MITVIRTYAEHQDFKALVLKLDFELADRDGSDHLFYHQFNKIDTIQHAVVVYNDSLPVGCGALKSFDSQTMELKRMYTIKSERGHGIASLVLSELEKWATELSFSKLILETGLKQPEAISLYQKNAYLIIPNYGQYAGVENSRCFEKVLSSM